MSVHLISVNGVYRGTVPSVESGSSDFDIRDTNGYVLTLFKDGHIKTKNFDSSSAVQTLESIEQTIESTILTIDSSADLEFIDPSSNCVMRVNDGHIRTKNFDSASLLETIDSSDAADLEFIDSSANCLMRLNNGHIKTKNFNSETLENTIDSKIDEAISSIPSTDTSRFHGKRLAIIADSISTYSGTMPSGYAIYYPKGDVNNINKMWWNIVCTNLSMNYTNCAWSGSQVTGAPKGTTAAAGCSDKRIQDAGRDGAPDIIIFYIGCNDWAYNTASLGVWTPNDSVIDDSGYSSSLTILDFKAAYALMLYKASKSYPYARKFCCTNLDDTRRETAGGYPSENSNGVTTYQWNQAIREVADAMGACIIDLHSCGINYANCTTFMVDGGTHPNATGQQIIASRVISNLIANY